LAQNTSPANCAHTLPAQSLSITHGVQAPPASPVFVPASWLDTAEVAQPAITATTQGKRSDRSIVITTNY